MGALAQLRAKSALACILVSVLGGLLFGWNISYVPAAIYLDTAARNCTAYGTPVGCNGARGANFGNDCYWVKETTVTPSGGGACVFGNRSSDTRCSLTLNRTACLLRSEDCEYDVRAGVCRHKAGWSAVEKGVLAGAMIIGAAISSFSTKPFTSKFGRRLTMLTCGLVALLGDAIAIAGWESGVFAVIIVGRIVVGSAVGVACVVCPLYTSEMAPPMVAPTIGIVFQTCVTFGLFTGACVLYSIRSASPHDPGTAYTNFNVFHALTFIAACGLLIASRLIPESTVWLTAANGDGDASLLIQDDPNDQVEEAKGTAVVSAAAPSVARALRVPPYSDEEDGAATELSCTSTGDRDESAPTPCCEKTADAQNGVPGHSWSRARVAVLAAALGVVLQLTGVNAIINFAPSIVAAVGVEPLTGNLILEAWFFATTLLTVPVSRVTTPRKAYLASVVAMVLSCVLAGVATMPAVGLKPAARLGVGGTGLLLFAGAFHAGCGPYFFVLAQTAFPLDRRELGSSLSQVANFAFNTVINIGYPIAAEGISGGPSGDQDKGLSAMFLIFAACGVAGGLAVQWLTRHMAGLTSDGGEGRVAAQIAEWEDSQHRAAHDTATLYTDDG